jgi:hypothetical protein
VGRRTDRWQQGLHHRRRDRPPVRRCSRCESAGDARTDFSVGTGSGGDYQLPGEMESLFDLSSTSPPCSTN